MSTETSPSTSPAVPASPVLPAASDPAHQGFAIRIVGAAAFAHLLNDMIQAVLPAVYPMFKSQFALTFGQIGTIALVYQFTASLLQPWVGMYTDKRPLPYLLPSGMIATFVGIGMMAMASSYEMLLLAAAVVPGPMVVVVMGAIGLATGIAGPSRDLLIRAAAPPNATGRVFGVVYSGLDTGMSVGPLLFGALMDGGHPAAVFIGVALFQTLAIATAIGAGNARASVPQKA